MKSLTALLAAAVLTAAAPAFAHHSIAGQFDMTKTVTLKGVVSKVDWVNPHIYITLDAQGTGGKLDPWRLECVPVGMARKAGLSKSMLAGKGETVTVIAHPARDGTKHLGFMMTLTFPDGRVFQFSPDVTKERP